MYFCEAKFARCFGVGTTCFGLDSIGATVLGEYDEPLYYFFAFASLSCLYLTDRGSEYISFW